MKWFPVTCTRCNLLVGWNPAPSGPWFFCIPCFDFVDLATGDFEPANHGANDDAPDRKTSRRVISAEDPEG